MTSRTAFRCRVIGLLVLLAIGLESRAATYVVASDRGLVARAEAIVAGTVLGNVTERDRAGRIRTITTIAVEEDFRGNATAARPEGARAGAADIDGAGGNVIRVATWGGRVGNDRMLQAGAPTFAPGERVLLLMERDRSGEWSSLDLALGKFTFAEADGEEVLARDASIEGWREDGSAHIERVRPREAFLQFVRDVVARRPGPEWVGAQPEAGVPPAASERLARRFPGSREEESAGRGRRAVAGGTPESQQAARTFSPTGYTIRYSGDEADAGVRRFGPHLTVSWRMWTASGVPAGIDPAAAVSAAVAAWRGATAGVADLSLSAAPATGSGTSAANTESRVIVNDPNGVVSGSCCPGVIATTFLYCSGAECDYVTSEGRQYLPITHADIVTNDGTLSGAGQVNFDLAVLHEMGHALGLRHSDKRPDDVLPCSTPYDCCFRGSACSAVMNAMLINGLSGLQNWDREAVACLYNGQCKVDPTCVAPVLTVEPNLAVPLFGRVALGVTVTPMRAGMQFQWYRGGAGDTSSPIGNGTERYWTEVMTRTTQYWVRVSSDCGSADSAVITVTVVPAKTRAVRR